MAVISIISRADVLCMSEAQDPVVMRLLADGVPLELLVDIALPPNSPPDAENPGYYRL